MERGIRRTYTWFYLPDDVFFEPVLKAYEGPDKFFLHNVNATDPKIRCKLVLIAMFLGAQAALRAVAPERWWSQTESNRRHPACKAGALPTELWPQ